MGTSKLRVITGFEDPMSVRSNVYEYLSFRRHLSSATKADSNVLSAKALVKYLPVLEVAAFQK